MTLRRSPSLTFDAQWNEETGWDFGFVQVSTDGGATYTSLSCTDTTIGPRPGRAADGGATTCRASRATPAVGRPRPATSSAYAGQNVLLSFRAFNDPGTLGSDGTSVPPGFWVDNVTVDGSVVSDGTTSPAGSRRRR